jgi:prevent-host-death family protein
MIPEETVAADDVRRRFRELLNEVEHQGAHLTVTRYGETAAVIVPYDWYQEARAMTKGERAVSE